MFSLRYLVALLILAGEGVNKALLTKELSSLFTGCVKEGKVFHKVED